MPFLQLPPPTMSGLSFTKDSVLRSQERVKLLIAVKESTKYSKELKYSFFRTSPNYLLRLCQQSDWKNIIKCCEMLTRVLGSPSSSCDLIKSARDQLVVTDRWGNTPLHIVCFHKPPSTVIKAILKAASHAIKKTSQPINTSNPKANFAELQLHTLRNRNGATPLLNACRSGACREVIQLLLDPPSKTMLPGGFTVFQSDHQGNTPLSGLVNNYEMLRKIPYFRKYCKPLEEMSIDDLELATKKSTPENHTKSIFSISVEGDDDDNCWDSFDHSPELWIANQQNPDWGEGCDYTKRDGSEGRRTFSIFWESVSHLIEAAWAGKNNDGTWRLRQKLSSSWLDHPIHAVAYLSEAMPPAMTDLILRLFTEKSRGDINDVCPLHMAIIRKQTLDKHPTSLAQRSYCIQRLLELDPSFSSTCIANSGRTALHQAAASGLHWSNTDGNPVACRKSTGPVQMLFEQAPECAKLRDPVSGLYPCMLAATSHHDGQTTANEVMQLNTIFELLRQAPELLQF